MRFSSLLGAIVLFSFLWFPVNANKSFDIIRHQWLFTFQGGVTVLATEYVSGIGALQNEFNHQPGLLVDFSLSRTLGKHWEVGLGMNFSQIHGRSDLPEFSANGIHPEFMTLYQLPVKYQTLSQYYYLFGRWYFREYAETQCYHVRLDPFVELSGGFNVLINSLKYESIPPGETTDVIFEKGQGARPHPGDVPGFSTGIGTRINFAGHINLITALNFDFMDYDNLDAVHNYDDKGQRLKAIGILTRFTVGVVIPLSNRLTGKKPYMPWAP